MGITTFALLMRNKVLLQALENDEWRASKREHEPRRRRFTDSAAQSAIAALPRRGRVITQCYRAFLAHHPDPVTMSELRRWAFAGQPRRHWHYWSITRALRRLNAVSLGRDGRPGIWALDAHTENPSK
jgi:hypothetical protein